MKYTPEFFRLLGEISETMLLGTLNAIPIKELPAAFDAFMTMQEEGEMLSDVYVRNPVFDTTTYEDGEGAEMQKETISFSQVMVRALAATTDGDLALAQKRWPERLWTVMAHETTQRQRFFNTMLFEAAGNSGCTSILDTLIDVGANPNARLPSQWHDIKGEHVTGFTDALCRRKIPNAMVLLARQSADSALQAVKLLTDGHYKSGTGASEHVESVWMARMLCLDSVNSRTTSLDLLDNIEGKLGTLVGDKVRLQMLGQYLVVCQQRGQKWDAEVIERMTHHRLPTTALPNAGEPPSPPTSLWASSLLPFLASLSWEKTDHAIASFTATGQALSQWMHILREAIKTHCYPVLEPMGPFLTRMNDPEKSVQYGNECVRCMDHLITGYSSHNRLTCVGEDGFYPEDMRRSLAALLGGGARFDAPINAMHALAQGETQGMLAKMILLIQMGADPSKSDENGVFPFQLIKDAALQEEWQNIARSFSLRKAAMALLESMDDPAPVATTHAAAAP